MRYYELTITPQTTPSPEVEKSLMCTGAVSSKVVPRIKPKPKPPLVFSSLKGDGKHNPNALQIEFDLPISGFHDPSGTTNNSFIRLSGVPLDLISQARNLNGALVELKCGMSFGLPLTDFEKSGLILSGQVFQAFGNWQGENMTMDIVVCGIQTATGDYSFQWTKGEKLADMVKRVIKRNHPSFTVRDLLSDNLVLSNDESGAYSSISQFATYVFNKSKSLITDVAYQGVTIMTQGNTIFLLDGSSVKKPKEIDYFDIIGQPTWIDFATIQVKLVMRADLFFGDVITLPPSATRLATQGAFNTKKDKTSFDGNYVISNIRNLGNYRQPDANSWCTIIDCIEQ